MVWASTPVQYDIGLAPSISASGPTAIEVHQGASGSSPLWYHTAALQSSGTVQFAASGFQYDMGEAPRIAIAGPTMLEVHEGDNGSLWYHTGAY